MKTLTSKTIKGIVKAIQSKYDEISLKLLGLIPFTSSDKKIVFKTTRQSILSLFLQHLGTRNPNKDEERAAKVLLSTANSYLNALKEQSTARVINDINALVSEKDKITIKAVKQIVDKEMDRSAKHLKLIAGAESQKATNTGTALKIAKIAESKGEEDPTVFFVVTIDERNDPETYRLHLLPDRLTPRVYKLSELGHGYHQKGDEWPKIGGTNPMCRCRLTYISLGYGFKNGKVSYIGKDHDEYKAQRAKYGLPLSADEFYPSKKKKKTVSK